MWFFPAKLCRCVTGGLTLTRHSHRILSHQSHVWSLHASKLKRGKGFTQAFAIQWVIFKVYLFKEKYFNVKEVAHRAGFMQYISLQCSLTSEFLLGSPSSSGTMHTTNCVHNSNLAHAIADLKSLFCCSPMPFIYLKCALYLKTIINILHLKECLYFETSIAFRQMWRWMTRLHPQQGMA